MTHARVAVVGAGPAGAAVATFLARAGDDVLLLDARPPRPGVGESLIPMCAPILQELGVPMHGFVVKRGAVFTRGHDAVRFDFSDAERPRWPHAWQVSRGPFDARLRRCAAEAGARLQIARVTGFDLPGVVHTDQGVVRCEWVVDAAGRDQLLARHLGNRRLHPTLRNAAVTAWYRGVRAPPPEQPGDIAITTFDGGWFWFIPLDAGTTSVGVVATPAGPRGRAGFAEALRRCPAAAARLEGAEPVEPLRGAADFSASASALHGDGWALAGDAATFLDPVFSTGVCLALHGARWLADALLDGADLDGYSRRVRAAVEVLEPVIDAFYAGAFLDVALSAEAREPTAIRRGVISLLAGDIFDPEFATARRLAPRLSALAARL